MTYRTAKEHTLNFWQIWNLSFGFLGVQFGWTLQMANMSAIYEYLGATPEQIPMLWLAAPVSGLIAQPIVGYFSDRTHTPLGRRKPYILAGALLSSLALIAMPNVSSLWMAAGLLWILDTSINLTTEPFRAFLADRASNEAERTRTFTMQAFFIGLGAVLAAACPWLLWRYCPDPLPGTIPLAVKLSFYVGAAFFTGAVLWTILRTPHQPCRGGVSPPSVRPEDKSRIIQQAAGSGSLTPTQKSSPLSKGSRGDTPWYAELWQTLRQTPVRMRQLAGVQFFTWLGMFCVFLYLPPAIARQIFGATTETEPLYHYGIAWAGVCIATYNISCFVTSWLLPRFTELVSRKGAYAFCLCCGGSSLISLFWMRDPYLILLPMLGFGVAWAGILSLPYSLVAEVLPRQHTGIYMGLFNACIVIPQIVAALSLGWIMRHWLGSEHLLVVVLGGVFFLCGAIAVQIIEEDAPNLSLDSANLSLESTTML
ncbi:MAG: SLC45 family MFS transporter [Spirulina sp. SIO3F2]|nr:SLC45 family MFS transporter [Spirulina sp. SIO3F2]